jgi:hypothetical protein
MKMDVDHPDAMFTTVLLDGVAVCAVAFDSDEGWVDCHVTEAEEPYPCSCPYALSGSHLVEAGELAVRRFRGKVEYLIKR